MPNKYILAPLKVCRCAYLDLSLPFIYLTSVEGGGVKMLGVNILKVREIS